MDQPDGGPASVSFGGCCRQIYCVQHQRECLPAHHRDQLPHEQDFPAACLDPRRVQQGRLEGMSTLTASPEYIELLKKFPPRVIRTEKENEACTEILYELDRRSTKLTPAEKELADLLTLLIEDFEDRHYQLPKAKPLEVLQFLMDQHGLLQKDLANVFGTPSIVSEVLSGKRELNKDHIKRLSRRHVSPELFF